MSAPLPKATFQQWNQQLVGRPGPLPPEDLELWRKGRDWLGSRVLASSARNVALLGGSRRRQPRARLAVRAHWAGLGLGFTEDLGFGGLSIRLNRPVSARVGEEASVRLTLAGRSVYVTGEVVWVNGELSGIHFRAVDPDDELLLQALVCERLMDAWGEA